MKRNLRILAFVATAAWGSSAFASTIYSSGGFDSTSRFATGAALEGQDSGKWTRSFASGTATVENTISQTASQAILVSHGNGDEYWFPATSAFQPANNPSTSVIVADWDQRIPGGSSTNNPVYGIEVFNSTGDSLALAAFDSTTGKLYTRNAGLGLVDLGTQFTASKDVWYHLQMRVDYSAQTFSILVDGVTKDLNRAFFTGSTEFSDADIVATSTTGSTTTGTAVFDNYVVSAVPEPAGFAALGLVGAGLLGKRRRCLSKC